jgi:hypothetical protein
MKILYYEINDHKIDVFGGKYFCYRAWQIDIRSPKLVAYASDRIWEYNPDNDQVRYIKNRKDPYDQLVSVDLKEFFLIQLRAEEY